MKPTEPAVDIVLDVLTNSHRSVCSEVLGKIVACQHGIYYLFQTKIFPKFSKYTEVVTVKMCSV